MSLEGEISLSPVRRWEALDATARRGWALLVTPFLAERERWALWLPAFVGLGILIYFAIDYEPNLMFLFIGLGGLAAAAWGARQRPGLLLLLAAAAALLAGLAAASLRAHWVAAPVLERPLRFAQISGEVAEVEPLAAGGVRVVLEHLSIERFEAQRLPERVRLRLPPKAAQVTPGQRIRLYASLMPPTGPAVPGGFDFARQAWFQRLGAIGYGMGSVEIVEPLENARGWGESFRRSLAALRLDMTRRIQQALPGDTGAVASALVTGGERAVSLPLLKAYRDSGLAHLLSISGLHMTLVAGLVFVGLRALLALIEPLALNYPIKKWTALGALLVTLFYLLVSGAFVPTQRSFLMTGLVLLGVVLDRKAISLRLVAWAALAILLTQPESLMGASFQMSFAAVLALVSLYELVSAPMTAWRRQGGWWRGFVLYLAGLLLSSMIAGLATAPFAIENFNRFNPYGIASNMLAVPISGVLVMPAALIGVLLMPLGLESWALLPMGLGVDLINAVALEVASWQGAGMAVPSFPPLGFACLVLGGLWLLLMKRSWRLLGLLGIGFALFSLSQVRLPDLLADGGPGLVALRLQDGRVFMPPGRNEPITREAWRRYLAMDDGESEDLADGVGEGALSCDALSCRAELNGVRIALARHPEALPEDCRSADLIVAPFMVPDWSCEGARIIDRRSRLKQGAHAVWLFQGRIERIETVGGEPSFRPWVGQRRQRRPDTESGGDDEEKVEEESP